MPLRGSKTMWRARSSGAAREATHSALAASLLALSLLGSLTGCGGAPHAERTTPAPSADPCRGAIDEWTQAREALSACEAPPPTSDGARFAQAEEALERVAARLDEGSAVSPEEAERAASAMWSALDGCASSGVDDAVLERVEYAAEGLLRAREGDDAREALAAARSTLGELRVHALGEGAMGACPSGASRLRERGISSPDPCAEERERVHEIEERDAACLAER